MPRADLTEWHTWYWADSQPTLVPCLVARSRVPSPALPLSVPPPLSPIHGGAEPSARAPAAASGAPGESGRAPTPSQRSSPSDGVSPGAGHTLTGSVSRWAVRLSGVARPFAGRALGTVFGGGSARSCFTDEPPPPRSAPHRTPPPALPRMPRGEVCGWWAPDGPRRPTPPCPSLSAGSLTMGQTSLSRPPLPCPQGAPAASLAPHTPAQAPSLQPRPHPPPRGGAVVGGPAGAASRPPGPVFPGGRGGCAVLVTFPTCPPGL